MKRSRFTVIFPIAQTADKLSLLSLPLVCSFFRCHCPSAAQCSCQMALPPLPNSRFCLRAIMLGCMMPWCHSFCPGLHLVLLGAVEGFPRWVRHSCVAATSTSCITEHGGWLGGGTRYRSQCSQWCRGWPLAHSKHHLGDVDVLDLKAKLRFKSLWPPFPGGDLPSMVHCNPMRHAQVKPLSVPSLLNPHIYQLQCGTPKRDGYVGLDIFRFTPFSYILVINAISHCYWSCVHQLGYRSWAPYCAYVA